MVEGILRLVPAARVGHIGLYRDHDTLLPVDYYFKIPGDVAERDFFVLDPMLATGGSAAAAVSSLKRAGATRIRFLCLVAAPEGVDVKSRNILTFRFIALLWTESSTRTDISCQALVMPATDCSVLGDELAKPLLRISPLLL